MKRPLVIGLALLLGAGLAFWWSTGRRPAPVIARSDPTTTNALPRSSPPAPAPPPVALPGDGMLRDYGSPRSTPRQDLVSLARVMQNFLLLAKPANQGPLADNEDWARALLGRGINREPLVSASHAVFNAQGRLVDRWHHPLFIHALGGGRFELRSAGPDGKLWSDDDIHRNADGTFRQGAQLNATNLWKP